MKPDIKYKLIIKKDIKLLQNMDAIKRAKPRLRKFERVAIKYSCPLRIEKIIAFKPRQNNHISINALFPLKKSLKDSLKIKKNSSVENEHNESKSPPLIIEFID